MKTKDKLLPELRKIALHKYLPVDKPAGYRNNQYAGRAIKCFLYLC